MRLFCWIRAWDYAQIRRRSKIRCPVIWGLESLRGRRMRGSGSGGEGFALLFGIGIKDLGLRIWDLGFRIRDCLGFKVEFWQKLKKFKTRRDAFQDPQITSKWLLDDPRMILDRLATFKKSQFSTKIRPNLAQRLGQIDLREQKEHTGSKTTKIDITLNAYFCWIRAWNYAEIRQRSKIRCPVVWGLESLRGRRIRDSGSGGGGLRPIQGSGFRI